MNQFTIIGPDQQALQLGTITQVIHEHALYYNEAFSFDFRFEARIAFGLSNFAKNFNPDCDFAWKGVVDSTFAGFVGVQGTAHEPGQGLLGWYIVSPSARGKGLGHQLLDTCIGHCRQAGMQEIFLWTFEALSLARMLYVKQGFEVMEEKEEELGGVPVRMQRMSLLL